LNAVECCAARRCFGVIVELRGDHDRRLACAFVDLDVAEPVKPVEATVAEQPLMGELHRGPPAAISVMAPDPTRRGGVF
jgi:hypothetical protein